MFGRAVNKSILSDIAFQSLIEYFTHSKNGITKRA